MGNGSSDWSGVRWPVEGSGAGLIYALQPSSSDNSGYSSISTKEKDNSTFVGEIDTQNDLVTITRLIERDEQTNADESIVRIENARVLKAKYWQPDAQIVDFEITLQGAYSGLVSLTAFALTATVGLLSF